MPYYKDNNTIFIRVPKTASSSMDYELGLGDGAMHETISSLRARLCKSSNGEYDGAFKFGFVRNPWDWLLSWTTYKQGRGWNGWGSFDFNSWVCKIGDIVSDRGGRYWPESYREKVSLEFTHMGGRSPSCGISSCRANKGYSCICLPYNMQHEFLFIKDKKEVDFIGRFENIDEDWKVVSSRIKNYKHSCLKRTNRSSNPGYKSAYSDKSADIIYNVYKKDIELFKYRF